MLKLVAIFAVLLAVTCTCFPAPRKASDPKTNSGQNKTQDAESQQPAPIPAPTIPQAGHGPTFNDYAQKESSKDEWDKATVFANYLLVIIGTGGIVAAVCTLRKIERQVRVAEADTQAMIRAERAWIVVSVETTVPGEFRFWATNTGKTPAKVASIWSCNITVGQGAELIIPSDDKTNESLLSSPPCLLPPTAKQIVWQCKTEDFQKISGGGDREKSLFSRGFVSAYIYGRIRYFNVLDTAAAMPHETRWLYWLVPGKDATPFPDPHHQKHNDYT